MGPISVILGTASGARNIGANVALAIGGCIILADLPVLVQIRRPQHGSGRPRHHAERRGLLDQVRHLVGHQAAALALVAPLVRHRAA